MSFGKFIEDEVLFGIEKSIELALDDDNVERFHRAIRKLDCTMENRLRGQEFLMKACKHRAYKCATLLLNGETHYIFDVNRPTPGGIFPIHNAATNCDSGMVELLLHHGARTDVRAAVSCKDHTRHLPLHAALRNASFSFGDYIWEEKVLNGKCLVEMEMASVDEKADIFQLLTLICLQRCIPILECVELLAWNTSELEDEFLRYAIEGKFLFIALLLAVAHKKLRPSLFFHQKSISSVIGIYQARKLNSLVVEMPWDKIEKFIKKKKHGVSVLEISRTVAGFLNVDPTFTDVTRLRRPSMFHLPEGDIDLYSEQRADDVGMAHYGTSGHRWGVEKPMGGPPPNQPKHVITEREKSLIPTEVDKVMPIPLPCFVNFKCSAAEFARRHRRQELLP